MQDCSNLKCYKCGRRMQMVLSTPLCPICDANVIIELNWVKGLMKK